MDKIEKIRQKIERLKSTNPSEYNYQNAEGYIWALDDLLSFLDTLEESEMPEPYNPVYDEAYLNEKIKKATESWKGVDVDKFMDEMRGREPEVDLEKEIDKEWKKCNPVDEGMGVESAYMHIEAFDMIARHFYELGKNSLK